MSRRIDIELTSDRGDGTWTWRAAGASKPRGVVDAALVPDGAKVGDVLRAETETDIEGVTITSLGSTQVRDRKEPERIEIVGSGRREDDQLVTTTLVPKGRGDRDRDRRDRRPRSDRPDGERGDRDRRPRREGERPGGPRGDGERRPRAEGDRDRDRRPRGTDDRGERRGPRRPAPPPLPERPKPKRLRPGRTHRKAVLADLPAEQQPIAEEVLRGGIPAVRQAIDAENEKRKANGEPPVGTELLKLAETLLPKLRAAEWRDKAEAALADADELDLRDLRTVVVASDTAARDEETRALAAQLRTKLDERVVAEQALWLEDLQLALDSGRIVRALRVSSRPPKAGTMLSPELRLALLGGANAALTEEATPDRWAAVLDAVAYSPVSKEVAPVSVPAAPSDELLATIKKYASRIPKVAVAFGVEVKDTPRPSGRSLRPPKPTKRAGTVPVPKREATVGLAAPVVTGGTEDDGRPLSAEEASTPTGPGPIPTGEAPPADAVGEETVPGTGAVPPASVVDGATPAPPTELAVDAGGQPVAADAPASMDESTAAAAPPAADEASAEDAAPDRVDALPDEADAEVPPAVAAADPYDEGPASPEVVEAAIEEAVESGAAEGDGERTDG